MSIGGRHTDAPAPAATVVRILQRNPGLRAHLLRPPIINRQYRVPYLAGSSIDGWTTYIDSQTPKIFPISRVEPDKTYPNHERPEWWLMVMRGMDYDPPRGLGAHPVAHGIEQMLMRLDGIDEERIEQYEKESKGLVNLDEHAKLPPQAFPPDLYLGPYLDDQNALDIKLVPLLQMAQTVNRGAA